MSSRSVFAIGKPRDSSFLRRLSVLGVGEDEGGEDEGEGDEGESGGDGGGGESGEGEGADEGDGEGGEGESGGDGGGGESGEGEGADEAKLKIKAKLTKAKVAKTEGKLTCYVMFTKLRS